MSIFSSALNWISRLFKSPESKKIMDLGVQIIKTTGVRQADKLAKVAYEAVKEAEFTKGVDKYEYAFKAARGALSVDDFKEDVINVAIEIALQALKKEIRKRGYLSSI